MIDLSTSFLLAVVPGLAAWSGYSFSKAMWFIGEGQPPSLPDWIVGPFGGFLSTIVALVWVVKKLNRLEAREEKRQEERDQLLRELFQEKIKFLEREDKDNDA